jgi:hypothetical protein
MALAHIASQDLKAFAPDGFLALDAGNIFGSLVERGNAPVQVNGVDTIRNRVQNNLI